jgi:hypothetical protein
MEEQQSNTDEKQGRYSSISLLLKYKSCRLCVVSEDGLRPPSSFHQKLVSGQTYTPLNFLSHFTKTCGSGV